MIIITGGAGFIGSNLIAGLERLGVRDIVVCDTLGDDDKWRNLAKREFRDFVCPENLFYFLEENEDKIEMIYHLGAISETTENDADLVIHNNFVLSRELWKWCANKDKRFVYASSYSVYGDGETEIAFKDDDSPDALKKLVPMNSYGWSKLLFDKRVARLKEIEGEHGESLPKQWAGLRFFNVYGPNEYHKIENSSVATQLYPQISANAAAKLFKSYHPNYKDGEQVRDFVWIGDCIDVLLWFYQNPDKRGLFNVGTGQGRSFNDLAKALFDATGKISKIAYVDMPEGLKEAYQYYTQADVSKLREAGYTKEFTSLEEGIKLYVKEYISKADKYL